MAENDDLRFPAPALEKFAAEVFTRVGVDPEDARLVANHLVTANLRGVDSHGMSRLGGYIKRLEMGLVNKRNEMRVLRETPVSVYIDAGNAMGHPAAYRATLMAVEKARTTGMAVAGVRNSNHCGVLAYYTEVATREDMIGWATTNASPNMAPWGGREAYLGTNPLSVAVPAGEEPAVILDMATSQVAKGKVMLAAQKGEPIPEIWAMTALGEPTTDARAALDGLLLPLGGPKGYCLSAIVDIMSGILTGAAFGPHIGDLVRDFTRPQDVGYFFAAIRADLFVPLEEFKTRMDQMIREIKEALRLKGVERIYLPGEIEYEKVRERSREGIPVSRELVKELRVIGARYGVALEETGSGPSAEGPRPRGSH